MQNPTAIVFVRHGQTDHNVARRWQGQMDIPLNETGHAQAVAVAKRLTSWPISALYTSDLLRASATAAAIGQALNLTPYPDTVWRERHAGMFQGMTYRERQEKYPEESAAFDKDHTQAPPGGGESVATLQARAVEAFEVVLETHPHQVVCVVSHGGTIQSVLRHVLGIRIGDPVPITLRGNTGITVVEAIRDYRFISLLNDVGHLNEMGFPRDNPRR